MSIHCFLNYHVFCPNDIPEFTQPFTYCCPFQLSLMFLLTLQHCNEWHASLRGWTCLQFYRRKWNITNMKSFFPKCIYISIEVHTFCHWLGSLGSRLWRRNLIFKKFIRGSCSQGQHLCWRSRNQDWAEGETGLWCHHYAVSVNPTESSGAGMVLRIVWVRRMELLTSHCL